MLSGYLGKKSWNDMTNDFMLNQYINPYYASDSVLFFYYFYFS